MPKGFSAWNQGMHPCKHCGVEVKGGGIGPHERVCKLTPEERFWSNVEKSDGCWVYARSAKPDGYRFFRYRVLGRANQVQWYAHRYSWFIANGEIPAGMEVAHRCDNRSCVRPDHLFLATHEQNLADMRTKGRARNMHSATRVCIYGD